VIARNSSFAYKGQSPDIRQVGRELGVRYVLEGSVRKAAARVRITGQLVEAETGRHICAERYDRAMDDVFALQDEMTMNVVAAIEPSLRQAEVERVKRKRPENLDAYDLVLRATPLVVAAMPETVLRALPLLERALTLEPDYALGSVEIHRELMTAATRWIMARKLLSVLSARIAMRLNSLSLQKKFSMRWRHLYISVSICSGVVRRGC